MANQKITDLNTSSLTTPSSASLLEVSEEISGAYTSAKVPLNNIQVGSAKLAESSSIGWYSDNFEQTFVGNQPNAWIRSFDQSIINFGIQNIDISQSMEIDLYVTPSSSNKVLASPADGSSGATKYRKIVPNDLTTISGSYPITASMMDYNNFVMLLSQSLNL